MLDRRSVFTVSSGERSEHIGVNEYILALEKDASQHGEVRATKQLLYRQRVLSLKNEGVYYEKS